MKSLKLWVTLGVVVLIGIIGIHGFMSNNKTDRKVNDTLINTATLENTQNNPNNNQPITANMNTTTAKINLENGIYIPQGTYEAPIELPDGNMHTDYLITGMVTSQNPISVYNTILDGSPAIKEYPAGTNLLVIGYVDGYFILGSASGDVDGLGYKTDTFVKADNMTLIPNESNLYALTLGNAPYKVDFLANDNNGPIKLYEYPTDLSKVVGVINPNQISPVATNNEADILNTANKMEDISFQGQQGWILTSDQYPVQYVSTASATSNNNGSGA
ncbi:MAG: hypothetical protein ACRDCW_08495 [Sarcina sp.]